jgi:hypothetical protein
VGAAGPPRPGPRLLVPRPLRCGGQGAEPPGDGPRPCCLKAGSAGGLRRPSSAGNDAMTTRSADPPSSCGRRWRQDRSSTSALRRPVDVDRGLPATSAHHDEIGWLCGGVALPVHHTVRHEDEIAGTGLDDVRATWTELHPQRTSEDVDHRLVLAMMMPAGHHPGLGANKSRPHVVGRDGLLTIHPRRRRSRLPVARSHDQDLILPLRHAGLPPMTRPLEILCPLILCTRRGPVSIPPPLSGKLRSTPGLDTHSRLVTLVRAGSARLREPLVPGGHKRSRPVCHNRRSQGMQAEGQARSMARWSSGRVRAVARAAIRASVAATRPSRSWTSPWRLATNSTRASRRLLARDR